MFNKDAINSCRTWAWSTSLMGFCFVRLCAVLIVCWTLRGKTEVKSPEEHPYAASMYHVTSVYLCWVLFILYAFTHFLGWTHSLFLWPWALFNLEHILYQLPLIYVLREVAVFQLTSQACAKDEMANTAKCHEVCAERMLVFFGVALGWLSKTRMSLSNLRCTW